MLENLSNSAQFLKYDPKKGDKQIDAFMKHLHQVANFNGEVLVAKHGKINLRERFRLGQLSAHG